jgi:hypothetical protein
MAKDTLAEKGVPQMPAGMNDNAPLEIESNFYQTRGIHSISELALQRCNGKFLYGKFEAPVLAIHGDLRNKIYVETPQAIYQFDHISDLATIPEFVLGDDGEVLLGDDGKPLTV